MQLSRRRILQSGIFSAPLLLAKRLVPKANAQPLYVATGAPVSGAMAAGAGETPAFIVRAGESRAGAPWKALGVPHFWAKILGADVDGHLALIECTTPAGLGPPVHIHTDQDEFMYIVEGSFGIQVDGRRSVLKAGDCYMVPRGTAHAYVVLGTQTARHLNVYNPAAHIEAFFASYDQAHDGKTRASGPPPLAPPLKASEF